jgi:hypothetical protein
MTPGVVLLLLLRKTRMFNWGLVKKTDVVDRESFETLHRAKMRKDNDHIAVLDREAILKIENADLQEQIAELEETARVSKAFCVKLRQVCEVLEEAVDLIPEEFGNDKT